MQCADRGAGGWFEGLVRPVGSNSILLYICICLPGKWVFYALYAAYGTLVRYTYYVELPIAETIQPNLTQKHQI